jgi:hypothetical protein
VSVSVYSISETQITRKEAVIFEAVTDRVVLLFFIGETGIDDYSSLFSVVRKKILHVFFTKASF